MTTRKVEPHQVGWLRRSELDTETIEVWERPDGKLYAHKKGTHLWLQVYRKDDLL